jgi:hypothetical protein
VIPSLETIAEGIQEDNPHLRLIQGLIQLLRTLFDVPIGFEEASEPAYESPYEQLPTIQ